MSSSDVKDVASLVLICFGAAFMFCGAWKQFSGDTPGAIYYAVEACAFFLLARS